MISWFSRWRSCSRIAVAEALILALIVAGAVCLRLRLLSEGIWGDEGFTYFDIIAPTLHGMIEHIRISEANPPLFFFLLRGWAHLFGFGETTLKIFSFLWSVAAVIVTYLLARRCVSRPVAMGAVFFIATSFLAIAYSNNVRPYSMTQFLATVCLLLYERVLFGGKIRTSVSWVVVAIALIWTHYVGIVILSALFISTIVVRRHIVVRPWVLITGYALIGASFLPWLSIAMLQVHSGTPWVAVATPLQRLGVIFETIGIYSPVAPSLHEWFGLRFGDLIATMLLMVLAIVAHRMMLVGSQKNPVERSTQQRSFEFVVLVLSINLTLLALTGYHLDRYFLPMMPMVCVLYAGLTGRIFEGLSARGYYWTLRCGLVSLGIVASFVTIQTIEGLRLKPTSGILTLVANAEPLASDSHVLWIIAPDYVASTVKYYFRNKQLKLHGFARWDEPQYLRIPGYAALWNNPHLVDNTLARVGACACNGFTRLALVRPYGLGYIFVDSGKIAYSREHIFEEVLRQRYQLIDQHSYPGRDQEASLMLFRLRCGQR